VTNVALDRFRRSDRVLDREKVHNKTAQELGGDFNSPSSS
jgi:hypothetical protein